MGLYYCSLIGTTLLISEALEKPCKHVFSLVSCNLQRIGNKTVSLTSAGKSIELKFQTEQSCLKFYNIVNSPYYAEIPDGESICGYTSSENSSFMERSKSFDSLQTEVKSPQYHYARFNTKVEKTLNSPKKPNFSLNFFTLRPKISDPFSDVYTALTQFVSPVYDYARVLPQSPAKNRNYHIYETIHT